MRRWDCAGYDECLTRAAKENAPDLPCSGCRDFEPGPAWDPGEVKAFAAACLELWAAVLDLERRDEEREREKAEREAWRREVALGEKRTRALRLHAARRRRLADP